MNHKKKLLATTAAVAVAATIAAPTTAEAGPRGPEVVRVVIQADGSNADGARLAMAEWNRSQDHVRLREVDRCWRTYCIVIDETWDAGDWLE